MSRQWRSSLYVQFSNTTAPDRIPNMSQLKELAKNIIQCTSSKVIEIKKNNNNKKAGKKEEEGKQKLDGGGGNCEKQHPEVEYAIFLFPIRLHK